MPREVITIQVGQCGNQVGCRFWDLILREHAHVSKTPVFDAPLSTFFRNVDTRYTDPVDIPVGDGRGEIRTLRARSILVDMEQGVVNSLLSGPLADLFDSRQTITDVSGSGNNWAHGHNLYGPMYRDSIEEQVRRAAEHCDSLQCFLLLHSLGGGTGSGLGSYVLESLEDFFPEAFRFVSPVCPSRDDDVVTSPYNATLALNTLIQSAHCVLPVSNDALLGLCAAAGARGGDGASLARLPQDERAARPARPAPTPPAPAPAASPAAPTPAPAGPRRAAAARGRDAPRDPEGPRQRRSSAQSAPPGRELLAAEAPRGDSWGAAAAKASPAVRVALGAERPFDRMNGLVAHLLNNLTSSMRFDGSLNLDLNEITMNLVPFPRMHFLLSAMSPLQVGKDPKMLLRNFHQSFADVLTHGNQLMNVDPRGSTHMAMAFLVRGSASISDVHRNIQRVRKQLKMLPYNEDAFKVGLCSVPPRGWPFSVLGLANSCAMHLVFGQILKDFNRLYCRKAHAHHYTQYMEQDHFDEAFNTVNSLMKDYIHLDMLHETPASCQGPPAPTGSAASSLLLAPSAWASEAAARQLGARSLAAPRPLL